MIQVVDTKADFHFRIALERRIEASAEIVFEALVDEIGAGNAAPDGTPIPMVVELRPGGRWYRDLGGDNGHLWGHVQAVKRPTLLELTGPLFMSNAVANNVQYRLEESGGATTLKLVHEAFGMVPEGALDGMPDGWTMIMDRIAGRFA